MNSGITVSDGALIKAATEAMAKAYAPYSKFNVGAALVTVKGNIYTGVNIENASYGLTVCAERVAAFNAVCAGETEIARIAVVTSSGEAVFPCGACRQVLHEFSSDLTVMALNQSKEIVKFKLTELLPRPFGGEALNTG